MFGRRNPAAFAEVRGWARTCSVADYTTPEHVPLTCPFPLGGGLVGGFCHCPGTRPVQRNGVYSGVNAGPGAGPRRPTRSSRSRPGASRPLGWWRSRRPLPPFGCCDVPGAMHGVSRTSHEGGSVAVTANDEIGPPLGLGAGPVSNREVLRRVGTPRHVVSADGTGARRLLGHAAFFRWARSCFAAQALRIRPSC
jgi:hypothetical protein